MLEINKTKLKKMLSDLEEEHKRGGFNEFSQFCEESLIELIDVMTAKQVEWLMKEIEDTSQAGIKRKLKRYKIAK